MEQRNRLKNFKSFFSNASLKHILKNWSQSEIGWRHPHGPVGVVLRDQGQVDIYSGRTRSILTMKGESVHLATFYSVVSDYINLNPKHIRNLRVLGKSIDTKIFNGQRIPAIKETLKYKWIIGPETTWNDEKKQFINPIPLEKVFEEKTLFDYDKNDTNLLPVNVEISNYIESVRK